MNYKEILSRSKEQKEAATIEAAVKKASIQIQADIFGAEQAISEAQDRATNLIENSTFNSDAIVSARRTVKNLEEDLASLKALQAELFSA